MSEPSDNSPSEKLSADELQAILEEYRWLGADQRHYNEMIRRDSQIFATVLASLLGVVYSGKLGLTEDFLDIIVPSTVFIFVEIQATNFYLQFIEAARRAQIERFISDSYQKPLMRHESYEAPKYLRNLANPCSVAILSTLALLAIVFLWFSIGAFSSLAWPFSLLHVFELIAMGITLWLSKKMFLRTSEAATIPEDKPIE